MNLCLNRCISPRSNTTPLHDSPLFVPEEEDKDWSVKPTQLIFRVSSKRRFSEIFLLHTSNIHVHVRLHSFNWKKH